MNYYGINRKVKVDIYAKDYKSPITKNKENEVIETNIHLWCGAVNMRIIEAFAEKYKLDMRTGPRPSDPFGRTVDVAGPRKYVQELQDRLK